MSTDASRFYYLRLMSRKTSVSGQPSEVTRPKFVQWSSDVQVFPVSLEEHPGLESEAMKIVRTVGQAFDLCQKKPSVDRGGVSGEGQEATKRPSALDFDTDDDRVSSTMSSVRARRQPGSTASLAEPHAYHDEGVARNGDGLRPSTSGFMAGSREPSVAHERPMTPMQPAETPMTSLDHKNGIVGSAMSPSRSTGSLLTPGIASRSGMIGDWVNLDQKSIQMSASLAETGQRWSGPTWQPPGNSGLHQPSFSNIPSTSSYPGPAVPFALMSPLLTPDSLMNLHSPASAGFFHNPFAPMDPMNQQQLNLQDFSAQQHQQLIGSPSRTDTKMGLGGGSLIDMPSSSISMGLLPDGTLQQGSFSPSAARFNFPLSSTNLTQQQFNAYYQTLMNQQQISLMMLNQQRGAQPPSSMSASWVEGNPDPSPASLTQSVEIQSLSLLRNQLDYAQKQAQVSIAHVYLLRDQLASETTARIESQARTQQLVQSNKELVEQVKMLVSRLQNLETRLSSQIITSGQQILLSDETPKLQRTAELQSASHLGVPGSPHGQQPPRCRDAPTPPRGPSPAHACRPYAREPSPLTRIRRAPSRSASKSPSRAPPSYKTVELGVYRVDDRKLAKLTSSSDPLKAKQKWHGGHKTQGKSKRKSSDSGLMSGRRSPIDPSEPATTSRVCSNRTARTFSLRSSTLKGVNSSDEDDTPPIEWRAGKKPAAGRYSPNDDGSADLANERQEGEGKRRGKHHKDEDHRVIDREPSQKSRHSTGKNRCRDNRQLFEENLHPSSSRKNPQKVDPQTEYTLREKELLQLITLCNLKTNATKKITQNHVGSRRVGALDDSDQGDPNPNWNTNDPNAGDPSSSAASSSSSEETCVPAVTSRGSNHTPHHGPKSDRPKTLGNHKKCSSGDREINRVTWPTSQNVFSDPEKQSEKLHLGINESLADFPRYKNNAAPVCLSPGNSRLRENKLDKCQNLLPDGRSREN